MTTRATEINLRKLILEDDLILPFRMKEDGVYESFNGQSFNAKIWNMDTDELLLEVSSGSGIALTTTTVLDDTVVVTFATADLLANVPPGTYMFRLYNTTQKYTFIRGKLNFINKAPSA